MIFFHTIFYVASPSCVCMIFELSAWLCIKINLSNVAPSGAKLILIIFHCAPRCHRRRRRQGLGRRGMTGVAHLEATARGGVIKDGVSHPEIPLMNYDEFYQQTLRVVTFFGKMVIIVGSLYDNYYEYLFVSLFWPVFLNPTTKTSSSF